MGQRQTIRQTTPQLVRSVATISVLILLIGPPATAQTKNGQIGRSSVTDQLGDLIEDLKGDSGSSKKNINSKTASKRKSPFRTEAIPSYIQLKPDTLLAKVGYETIRAGDILWAVDPFLRRHARKLSKSQLDLLRRQSLAKYLRSHVTTLLLHREYIREFPIEGQQEMAEKIRPLVEQQVIEKKFGVETIDQLDRLLQQHGGSFEKLRDRQVQGVAPRSWLKSRVSKQVAVSDEEVEAYYERHRTDYRTTASARWEQVMVRFDRFNDRESAHKAITKMASDISSGTPLAEVARIESHGFRAETGGQNDWTNQGSLRAEVIDAALFDLPVGELSDVIESDRGYHLVRVLERRNAKITQLNEAREEIESRLRSEQVAVRKELYMRALRSRVRVWTILDSRMPTPAEGVKPLVSAPISGHADLVCVPVTTEGVEWQFIVDTGADRCVFDESFRPLLGKRLNSVKLNTAGEPVSADLFPAPPADIQGFSIRTEEPVYCIDMTMLRQALGIEIYGIVGMSFLRNFVVQFDMDRGLFSLYRQGDLELDGLGTPAPIVFRKPLPWISVQLPGGREEEFLVDSGCNTTGDLAEPLFNELSTSGVLEVLPSVHAVTAGGIHEAQQGALQSFSVAGHKRRDLLFSAAQDSKIGIGFLARFVTTFDFPNRTVYWKKGRQFAKEDKPSMGGLFVMKKDGKSVVHLVRENSAAAKAGILPGDVITHLNNKPSEEYEHAEAARLFRSAHGDIVDLKLQRDDRQLEVKVVLEDPRQAPKRTARRESR